MDAKEFFHRYAAQMRREADETAADDVRNCLLKFADQSDRLADGACDEDHTIQL